MPQEGVMRFLITLIVLTGLASCNSKKKSQAVTSEYFETTKTFMMGLDAEGLCENGQRFEASGESTVCYNSFTAMPNGGANMLEGHGAYEANSGKYEIVDSRVVYTIDPATIDGDSTSSQVVFEIKNDNELLDSEGNLWTTELDIASVIKSDITQDGIATSDEFEMQVTVLNFLRGNVENANVKNKVLTFSVKDRNKEQVISRNSKVKVVVLSNNGKVKFKAIDARYGQELTYSSGLEDYIHGETKGTLRIHANNPYGFTYIMAEDITGINKEALAEYNELNSRLSKLREEVLLAERDGREVSEETIAEIRKIESKMREVSERF